jgi:hypothetical protein
MTEEPGAATKDLDAGIVALCALKPPSSGPRSADMGAPSRCGVGAVVPISVAAVSGERHRVLGSALSGKHGGWHTRTQQLSELPK